MRLRSLLLVLLALVMAGGSALLARGWLQSQRAVIAAEPAAEAPRKAVLVAHAALAPGQLLKPGDLVWLPWPDDAMAPTYIQAGSRKLEDFTGYVVRMPMLANEPIAEGRIVAPGDRGFLAAVLRPGLRAVSVAVTATSGISGFVFPGDRVDLVLVHSVPQQAMPNGMVGGAAGFERRAAETVLRGLRVLAIDQKTESKANEVIIAHTATLEVTSKQSEVIAVVAEMGKLSLSLHSLADEQMAATGPNTRPEGTSYTLDSQASRLLPRFMGLSGAGTVTVLRAGKAEDIAITGAR